MSSLPKPINVGVKVTISVLVISAVSAIAFYQSESLLEHSPACCGNASWQVICEDGEVVSVRLKGSNLRTTTSRVPLDSSDRHEITKLPQFSTHESYLGENGLTIQNDRHYIYLVPGGRSGLRIVYGFDYLAATPGWESITVYCLPLSLVYRESLDQIVGHCDVINTTYGSSNRSCVPHFLLRLENGKWTDKSISHLCSESLRSIFLSAPVIVKHDDDETDSVLLYFAEQRTNRLHEVGLSIPEANVFTVGSSALMIKGMVQAINNSFTGLLVTFCFVGSSTLYHQLFSLETHEFVGQQIQTDLVVFNSFNLDYFVSFNAHRDKVIVVKDGISTQHLLHTILDTPIQCQNMPGPNYHFLVCLSGGGFRPLLINITTNQVTYQTIPFNNSKITGFGKLTQTIFYLYTVQQQAVVYLVDAESTVRLLESYSFCRNNSFVLTDAVSNLKCNNSHKNVDVDNGDDGSDHNGSNDSSHDVDNYLVPIILSIIVVVAGCITVILVVICLYNRSRRRRLQMGTSPCIVHPKDPGIVITELDKPMVRIGLNIQTFKLVEAQECTQPSSSDMPSKLRHVPDGRE